MCLAVPGRVETTFDAHGLRMGRVDFGGVAKDVCLEHVPTASVGDWVLVHVGFALTRLDPDEAARHLALLREIGDQIEEELGS